MHGSASMK